MGVFLFDAPAAVLGAVLGAAPDVPRFGRSAAAAMAAGTLILMGLVALPTVDVDADSSNTVLDAITRGRFFWTDAAIREKGSISWAAAEAWTAALLFEAEAATKDWASSTVEKLLKRALEYPLT